MCVFQLSRTAVYMIRGAASLIMSKVAVLTSVVLHLRREGARVHRDHHFQ